MVYDSDVKREENYVVVTPITYSWYSLYIQLVLLRHTALTLYIHIQYSLYTNDDTPYTQMMIHLIHN